MILCRVGVEVSCVYFGGWVYEGSVSLLVCCVVVCKGRARGCSPFRQFLVNVHVGDPRGGAFLANIRNFSPPVTGRRSGVVLGSAGWGVCGGGLGIFHSIGRLPGEVLVGPQGLRVLE